MDFGSVGKKRWENQKEKDQPVKQEEIQERAAALPLPPRS